MHCVVTRDPIDVEDLLRRVRSDADGAVLLFTGVVRDHHEGRAVEALSYEAFEEMAVGKIEKICEDVRSRFEVGDIAVAHRVGDLAIGDVSVAIAVAAPHRDAAYAGSREIIERLKREVPIWKRERYDGGEEAWRGGHAPEPPTSG
jgi:molybdopterin synthase catalytic subunit